MSVVGISRGTFLVEEAKTSTLAPYLPTIYGSVDGILGRVALKSVDGVERMWIYPP